MVENTWMAMELRADDPLALAAMSAIQTGDVDELRRLLRENENLATARIVDARAVRRSLPHIAADWPGHVPNGAKTIALLADAGSDLNARVAMPDRDEMRETPLHWAASSDDVEVLDALLDHGADIEADGAVFTGGTAMSDAVVFAQWNAARRLLERGARTTLWQAAALGLHDRVASEPAPSPDEITNAFWHACRGGQRRTAEYLLNRGADLNWIGHDRKTPLAAAMESGAEHVVEWLRELGAKA